MFKMVVGNNGRTIYCGKVVSLTDDGMFVTGVDWNANDKKEFIMNFQVQFDEEVIEKAKQLTVGGRVVFSMMPSRKDPNVGVCEEIALPGEILITQNANGNEKIVAHASVGKMVLAKNEKTLRLSLKNLSIEGTPYGSPYTYDQFGYEVTTHWVGVTFFAQTDKNKGLTTIDNVTKFLKKGDTTCFVITRKDSVWNGETRTNHTCDKYMPHDEYSK